MGLGDKFKHFLSPMDEDDVLEVEEEEEEAQTISQYEKKSTSANKIPHETKMVLYEPRSFEDAEETARQLMNNKAAVVNLHRLQPEFSQRVIDFLYGVVFALHGSIQQIGDEVFLCTPHCVPVQGQIKLGKEEHV